MTAFLHDGDRPPLLALVGPTAVGKTEISLRIAKAFDCEIISGDSMQVYRGMDIGTAKLPLEERQGIPHHLIDICDPTFPFTVSEFQARCRETISDIVSRGKLPFIVGGTGLYVESVCYDFQFQEKPADETFRAEMAAYAKEHGAEALHAKLAQVDAETAAKLHPNDERRIIRALEVHRETGKPLSEAQSHKRGDDRPSPYNLCLIGLEMDRARLYERINRRVDEMMVLGLVEEVSSLLSQNVPRGAVAMQGLGYKEIAAYLDGETTLEAAVERIKQDTRKFAKRQLSWFRHMRGLEWVDVDGHPEWPAETKNNELFRLICAIIAGKFRVDMEYSFQE